MDNKISEQNKLSVTEICVSVLCAYVASLGALPSSGFFTCLPVAAVMTLVALFFCKSRKLIYISMAVMPVITTLLFGYEIKYGILSAAVAVASAYFVLLAKRAFVTLKKSQSDAVKTKSKTVLVISCILTLAVWLVFCGNPVSFLISDVANKEYAKELYQDKVKCENTYFDAFAFDYLTEVTFDGAEAGKMYYISANGTDGFKDHHIDSLIFIAKDYFERKTALPADDVMCYIDKNTFVYNEEDFEVNFAEMEYLVPRTEQVTGRAGFRKLYTNLMVYADQSEYFIYKSIIITANGMNGKTYYAYKEYGKEPVFMVDTSELVEKFS